MKWIICFFITIALFFLGSAIYIPAKAGLAQILLQSAWEKSRNSEHPIKPWPWADTHPIARLLMPDHDIDQIVLDGDQGNSLAFGPGLHPASDIKDTSGTVLISGHRDTHFNFLKDIKLGETLELQTKDNTMVRYRVQDIQIVNTVRTHFQAADKNMWLVLVTCYPFNTIRSDPSMRYVVMAEAISL